jgi:hypothetical protein
MAAHVHATGELPFSSHRSHLSRVYNHAERSRSAAGAEPPTTADGAEEPQRAAVPPSTAVGGYARLMPTIKKAPSSLASKFDKSA